MKRRTRNDAGQAAMEFVLLVTAIWAMVVLAVITTSWIQARDVVVNAARVAAEAAAAAPVGTNPQAAADAYASAEMGGHGVTCAQDSLDVTLIVVPNKSATATVSCQTSASRVILPGFPGSVHLTGTWEAAITPLQRQTGATS